MSSSVGRLRFSGLRVGKDALTELAVEGLAAEEHASALLCMLVTSERALVLATLP